jgi:hypothetical protein
MATPGTDSYDNEREDFARVIHGIAAIRAATLDQLRELDWLAAMLREVGLAPIPDSHLVYEGEEDWVNPSQQGLIQLPREFAQCLMRIGECRPRTYCEIGCFNGATACIATAYLQRFNPELQATTIDLWPAFIFYREIRDLLPLHYVVGKTSYDFAGAGFDAVFIDGDHSFAWAWADYQNVGRDAKICAIHDIHNAPYLRLPLGGVCGCWELIRRDEGGPGVTFHEFREHPRKEFMGIGVRIRP